MRLCTSVLVKQSIAWWSDGRSCSVPHTVYACMAYQAALTAWGGEDDPPKFMANLAPYTELCGWESLRPAILAFMHGSAHQPRTLCDLLHLSLIACKCSAGGGVPGACRAIAWPDLCRASHTRSWLCIINFLGSCLLNGCPTHSECWIGFLHCHLCDSSRCASPLFSSRLPWVDPPLVSCILEQLQTTLKK